MIDPSDKSTSKRSTDSLISLLSSMDGYRLGVLAFNLTAWGWVGLHIALAKSGWPVYLPTAYLNPNIVNAASALILVFGSALAVRSIAKGSLIPSVPALTFAWSFIASLARQLQ
jgi:hypothetical protein